MEMIRVVLDGIVHHREHRAHREEKEDSNGGSISVLHALHGKTHFYSGRRPGSGYTWLKQR